MGVIIAREHEKEMLEHAFKSGQAELIALFGRRRVGKTYLIRNTFFGRQGTVYFSVTGMKDGELHQQIKNFMTQLGECFYGPEEELATKSNWFDAFDLLARKIKQTSKKKKIVLFFDEFPWMATRKSDLLMAFEYFWNQHMAHEDRVKVVLCGSSAGWMIRKIINNRGALYNRVTCRIHLEPFTLNETRRYLRHRKVNLNIQQIAQLYMILGGIPFYLAQIQAGLSPAENIAKLAFKKHSFLLKEFENLYATLFYNADSYCELARIIASHRYGIGLEDLASEASLSSSGGSLIKKLSDLEKAGFIEKYKPFCSNKKGKYYKMIDEYSLFYFKWIEPIKGTLLEKGMRKGDWQKVQASQAWAVWSGYAFELLCYKHIFQIMDALKVSDSAVPHTWRFVPAKGAQESGAQIDLLFDRDDGMITVCEMKYTKNPFVLDKEYAHRLNQKLHVLKEKTKTQKPFALAFISSQGMKKTMYSEEMVSAGVCSLGDLFKRSE